MTVTSLFSWLYVRIRWKKHWKISVRIKVRMLSLWSIRSNHMAGGRKSAEKEGSFRHFRERAAVSKVGFWMHSFCQEQSSRQHSVRSEEERAAGKKHWHTYLEKATFHIRSFRKCITGRSHILAWSFRWQMLITRAGIRKKSVQMKNWWRWQLIGWKRTWSGSPKRECCARQSFIW